MYLQECRPIYCGGYGHLSTEDSCSDDGIEVLSDVFSICLNFTFVRPISLTTFQDIMTFFTEYLPSWGGLGSVDSVYYKLCGSAVSVAIVTLNIQRNELTYKALINTIKQQLANKSIVVVVEQETIAIVHSVSEYSRFVVSYQESSFGNFVPYWSHNLYVNENEPAIAQQLNINDHIYEPWIDLSSVNIRPRITKLSFCRQVELLQRDIEIIHDIALYIRINDKFVFENNFVAVRDKETNRLTVRVCLEDFLNEDITSASMSSAPVFRLSYTSSLAILLMFVFTGLCMQHL